MITEIKPDEEWSDESQNYGISGSMEIPKGVHVDWCGLQEVVEYLTRMPPKSIISAINWINIWNKSLTYRIADNCKYISKNFK